MSNSLNEVNLIGNITQEFEVKQTKQGDAVVSINLATNRPIKGANDVWSEVPEYHTVVLFGKLAEIAEKYLHKGDKVFFKGRLQTRSWEAEDGSKRYKTEIAGKEMIMLGSRQREEASENREYAKKSQNKKQQSIDDVADDLEGKNKNKSAEIDDLPF